MLTTELAGASGAVCCTPTTPLTESVRWCLRRTPTSGPAASTMPRPKGTRNGQPYYGRVWCDENKTNEVERLRPVRAVGVDQMFTVLHKT